MAASTGRVLHEWFSCGVPLDQLLAGLDSTIAQPGWSPVSELALSSAKHVVADYVSSPRRHDSSIDQGQGQGQVKDQAEILDAGVMLCLELLRSANHIRSAGNRPPR